MLIFYTTCTVYSTVYRYQIYCTVDLCACTVGIDVGDGTTTTFTRVFTLFWELVYTVHLYYTFASNKLGEYRCILSSWSLQINSIGLACCTVVAMINADRSTTSMGFTLSWIMVSNSVLLKQWVAQTTTCNEQLSNTLTPDFVKASIKSNALFLWCCCCSTLKARLTVGGDNSPACEWWCVKKKARKTTDDVGCEINDSMFQCFNVSSIKYQVSSIKYQQYKKT